MGSSWELRTITAVFPFQGQRDRSTLGLCTVAGLALADLGPQQRPPCLCCLWTPVPGTCLAHRRHRLNDFWVHEWVDLTRKPTFRCCNLDLRLPSWFVSVLLALPWWLSVEEETSFHWRLSSKSQLFFKLHFKVVFCLAQSERLGPKVAEIARWPSLLTQPLSPGAWWE